MVNVSDCHRNKCLRKIQNSVKFWHNHFFIMCKFDVSYIHFMKNILLASTSTIFGSDFLEYLLPELEILFKNCSEIIFIPFARPGGITHNDYTNKVAATFAKIGKSIKGLHEFDDMKSAITNAKGIFTGGGNTFLLVSKLYEHGIMKDLKTAVEKGCSYLGTSAGSNIAGISMKTTNDMPIVYPASFVTLGLIPFTINPHYIEYDASIKHMGETRETRINEFHTLNNEPVIGLREGSWISVKDDEIILKGSLSAKLFRKELPAIEVESNTRLNQFN